MKVKFNSFRNLMSCSIFDENLVLVYCVKFEILETLGYSYILMDDGFGIKKLEYNDNFGFGKNKAMIKKYCKEAVLNFPYGFEDEKVFSEYLYQKLIHKD